MKYLVFNQFYGKHERFETIEEARFKQSELLEIYADASQIGTYMLINEVNQDKARAVTQEYSNKKLNGKSIQYLYSVFNCNEQKTTHHLYLVVADNAAYGVKICLTLFTVVELYKQQHNDANFAVSLDLNTHEVLELYEHVDNYIIKKNLNGAEVVKTFIGGYETLPESKKQTLADFEHKDRILRWSNKPYGFCLEYIEQRVKPFVVCSAEEKEQMLKERNDFKLANSQNFSIVEVIQNNGNEVWKLL